MKIELDPEELSIVVCLLGGFIICFGLVSYFVKERLRVSEALVSVIVGIILGPRALDLLDPTNWGSVDDVTRGFTRMVIAIQVMFSGVALPKAYLIKEMKSLLVLLIPVMGCAWFITGLAIWLILPPITFLESLVLASCVTSTDPILANSVVKGKFAEKHVPPHIRNLLSAESGATDGLADQFLYLSLYLIEQPSFGSAVEKWILLPLLYKIGLSIVIGIAAGYVARKLVYFSEKNRLIDKESFLVFAIALALFLMGFVSIIGSDDLLACFIAGSSFTWDDWFRRETEEAHLQEVVDLLLNLAVFVFIGSLIPWSSFGDFIPWWKLLLLSISVLVFRRMPAVFTLSRMKLIPAVKTYREALFTGWFGPMGVGAIYCSTVVKARLEGDDSPHTNLRNIVQPVVFFLVFSSIMVHGITIPLVMISKRINTRTFTASSVSNQVSQLQRIRFGQDISYASRTIPSVASPDSEESGGGNASESTTIEIISPHEEIISIEYQRDKSEITSFETCDAHIHDLDLNVKRDSIRESHDLNLDQIRGGTSRKPHEIDINIPHGISKRRDPKSEKNNKGPQSDHNQPGSLRSKYAIWDEGDNYIIENYEGEDIMVIPSPSAHHRDHRNHEGEGNWSKIHFFRKQSNKSMSPTKDRIEDEQNNEKVEIKGDKMKVDEGDKMKEDEGDKMKEDEGDNKDGEDEIDSKGRKDKGKNIDSGEMG